MAPRFVLNGEGEAYAGELVGVSSSYPNYSRFSEHDKKMIVFKLPANREVSGRVLLPNRDCSGMEVRKFIVHPDVCKPISSAEFNMTKRVWAERKLQESTAGQAWFRKLWRESDQASGKPSKARTRDRSWDELRMLNFSSGSRALTENLALDRLPEVTGKDRTFVNVGEIEGITIEEINWRPLVKDVSPKLDSLSKVIPADQHAVYFSGFSKLVQLIDEYNTNGTVLDVFAGRIEQDRTMARYEKQLAVQLNTAARAFGSSLAKSIAITGSDLEFAMGTDIAILFESPSPDLLVAAIRAQQQAAISSSENCKADNGKDESHAWFGALTDDRIVSSYVCKIDETVVLTNSKSQLARILKTATGKAKSMSSLDEFKFFRDRYSLSNADETVFVMLTDAAIRRWSSPVWRIGAARRAKAAALLADATARNMPAIVAGQVSKLTETPTRYVPGLKQLEISNDGVASETYGHLKFMTPIVELGIEQVTESEKAAYDDWRVKYSNNWRKFFDPIGISLSVKKRTVGLDVTIMPLTDQSGYNDLVEFAVGGLLEADEGDRHPGSMFNMSFAINKDSEAFKEITNFLPKPKTGKRWDWLGKSGSLVFEHDAFWVEAAEAMRKERANGNRYSYGFVSRNINRLPIYLRIDAPKAPEALDFEKRLHNLIHGFIQTYCDIEHPTHEGVTYTRYVANDTGLELMAQVAGEKVSGAGLSFGYTGRAFVIAFSDRLMQSAIERDQARLKGIADGKPVKEYGSQWAGKHFGFQADLRLLEAAMGFFNQDLLGGRQLAAWGNIPILNEWKKQFPNKDPLKVQEQIWNQSLRCPGGGTYEWNEEFQTYESTIFGHPADPHKGPVFPEELQKVEKLNFGLTFEHDGLRSKAELRRSPF